MIAHLELAMETKKTIGEMDHELDRLRDKARTRGDCKLRAEETKTRFNAHPSPCARGRQAQGLSFHEFNGFHDWRCRAVGV